MKTLIFFLIFIIVAYSQSNLFINFNLGKENYNAKISQSKLVPSIGLEYVLVLDSLILFAISTEYSFHSVYLKTENFYAGSSLTEGYYDANYLLVNPTFGFQIYEDISLKAGLAFNFLISKNYKYFPNDLNSPMLFMDVGAVNLIINKRLKFDFTDFVLGLKYNMKFKSSLSLANNDDREKKLSSIFFNIAFKIL